MLRAIINNDVDVLDSLHPKKRTAKTVEFFMQFNFVVHLPPKKTIINLLLTSWKINSSCCVM